MPKAKTCHVPITVEAIDGDGFHIFTRIHIGKRELRALIDTGASKSVIGQSIISDLKKVKLISESESQAKGIGEQMLTSNIALVKKLKLGEFELKNCYVGVLDISHITETYKAIGVAPFDVILGGDVLKHFSSNIDYKKKRLKLYQASR